jgi:undecaprenyl pyrophosphate phosphatase UppP
MAQQDTDRDRRRDRVLVNALWVVAAVTVVSGFVVRSLSTFMGRSDFRLGGVLLIALGIAFAVLGWIGERIVARRAH